MRICSKCRNLKPKSEFHSRHNRPKQLQSWCKECVRKLNREKYARNPGPQKKAHKALYERDKKKIYARHRKWNKDNPERVRELCRNSRKKAKRERPNVIQDSYLRRTYGISLVQFDELVLAQGGCCAVCDCPAKLCVDHDHKTNKVRGLLCGNCNRAIGLLKDSPSRAQKVAWYLS